MAGQASQVGTAYVVAYNLAQALGWAMCLVQLALGGYEAANPWARYCQLAAILETVHAATGLVPASASSAFLQWLARSNALCMVLHAIPELHSHPLAAVMLASWSIGEMIRYPWYALHAIDKCPAALTWLRYTAFILNYPTGFVAESSILVLGLPYLRQRDMYSVHLPNKANWGFDYVWFMMIVLAVYPFLWWQQYSALLRSRSKKLAGGKQKSS